MASREDRLAELGRSYEKEMGRAAIEKCNCMIRYNGGPQLPAIKRGKVFFSPQEDEITKPDSYEMMHFNDIVRLMNSNNEVYIGHML